MEKGIADKWAVYAYKITSGAAVTGGGANISATLYKDGSTSGAATTDTNPTELSGGYYQFGMTTAENNVTEQQIIVPVHSSSGTAVIAYPGVRFPRPQYFRELGIESDGDLTKVNTLDGQTPQTGDTYSNLPANFSTQVISTSGVANSNVKLISDDATAADNLELMYDGTGYTDETAPSSRSQVSNLAVGSGSISVVAESFTKAGAEPETNTYTATHELDLSYHIVEDDGGSTDCYYQFDVGGSGVPTEFIWAGYAQSNGDSYIIYAYNWSGTSWDQIGSLDGSNGTTRISETFKLTTAHVGSGANLGKVRMRLLSADGTAFATDRVLCDYAVISQSAGYANGAIWVNTNASNTNTENYVDGVVENPVSTWAAALTLSGQLGIERFEIINGSSITLSGNSDNYTIVGSNWTLALNGQSIVNTVVNGSSVSGVATGSSYEFFSCSMGNCTLADGFMLGCAIAGDIIGSAAGSYFLDKCFSGIAGTATPSFDFGAAVVNTNLNMRHYSGGIEIKNMGGTGTDNMSLEGHGQLVLNANCDPSNSPVIAIRGHFTITDNVVGGFVSGGGTISDDARYDVTQISDSLDSALDTAIPASPTADSMNASVQAIKRTVINKMEITEANGNTVVYKDDDTTPHATVAAAYTTDATTTTRKRLE